jgi:hypothetical protein
VYLLRFTIRSNRLVPRVVPLSQITGFPVHVQMMDILPDTDIPGMVDKVKELVVSGITVSSCLPRKQ